MNNNENNIYNNMSNTTGYNNMNTNVNNTTGYSNMNTSVNNTASNMNNNMGYINPQVNSVDAGNSVTSVSNINKEEVMEEALSHTNQYTPFEIPKQEVIEAPKQENPKSAYILIIVIVIIMALFIVFLPQISKLLGW